MSQMSANIVDFQQFRLRKQHSHSNHTVSAEQSLASSQLDQKIENIKKSIQRINSLMAELKSISEPQHHD